MPIYEYRCQECGRLFEKLQPVGAGPKAVACPSCGSGRVERQLSVFASTAQSGASSPSSGCAPSGGGG